LSFFTLLLNLNGVADIPDDDIDGVGLNLSPGSGFQLRRCLIFRVYGLVEIIVDWR